MRWIWEAPPFQRIGYRVYSVSSPGGTTYEGGPFNSGETKTAKGRILSHYTSTEMTYSAYLELKEKSSVPGKHDIVIQVILVRVAMFFLLLFF